MLPQKGFAAAPFKPFLTSPNGYALVVVNQKLTWSSTTSFTSKRPSQTTGAGDNGEIQHLTALTQLKEGNEWPISVLSNLLKQLKKSGMMQKQQ